MLSAFRSSLGSLSSALCILRIKSSGVSPEMRYSSYLNRK